MSLEQEDQATKKPMSIKCQGKHPAFQIQEESVTPFSWQAQNCKQE